MEMVIPASDMMFAWMSMMPSLRSSHISRNANSTDSGSVTQMTKALRKCQRMRRIARVAMSISWPITVGERVDGAGDEAGAVVGRDDRARRAAARIASPGSSP